MRKTRETRGQRIRDVVVLSAALALLIGFVLIAGGCASRRTRTVVVASDEGVDVVYIETAPPAPRIEVISKRPTPKAIWIPGYWMWNGSKYVWADRYNYDVFIDAFYDPTNGTLSGGDIVRFGGDLPGAPAIE